MTWYVLVYWLMYLLNAFHAYGHVWIYYLIGTYAMMHLGMGIWSRWWEFQGKVR